MEDRTAVRAEPTIKEEEQGGESEGTVVASEDKTQIEETQTDSLVEDLLSDEEEL